MKKRLAFISTNDHVPWGGSEVLWSKAALRMTKEYSIGVSAREWSPLPDHIQELKTARALLFLRRKQIPTDWRSRIARKLLSVPTPPVESPEDKFSILRHFQPEMAVLSLGDHNSSEEWMEECRRLSIPYVIIVQLVKEAHLLDDNHPRRLKLKSGYQKAKKIYCVSQDNLHLLKKQYACSFPQAEVVYNPFREPQTELPFPSGNREIHLAVVASIRFNHKGQDLLFDVLRSEKWRKRPVTVNLYGKGPHEQAAKELIVHWKLEKKVKFHGFEPDLDKIYTRNHALLLPSRMEGMSLALLEAIMHQRVPIVTNLGDSRRLITDNETGFLIQAPTAFHVEEALERAWQARSRWEMMGKLAREQLRKIIPADPIAFFCNSLNQVVNPKT